MHQITGIISVSFRFVKNRVHRLFYGILKLLKYSLSAPAAYDKMYSVCCGKQQDQQQRCDTVRKNIDISQLSPEELEAEKLRRRKKLRRKKVMTVVDRIFGFFLATGIVLGCAGLALGMIICRGPSEALKVMFVQTALETRRFDFVPQVFLPDSEVHAIYKSNKIEEADEMDASLIKLPAQEDGDTETEAVDYGTPDEDGDGIVFKEIKGNGYAGYMLICLDPGRVFVGKPDSYGGVGLTLEEMCLKYDAVGGINAGGFLDDAGTGLGGFPDGLTVIEGVMYSEGHGGDCFAGLDVNNLLWVGFYGPENMEAMQIRDGVSFGPILIQNGEIINEQNLLSGVNPRTAIGQRGDGAILMLVVDGRQAHSIGATYLDMAEGMLDYGAVNAMNMDGGSSTVMWYEGQYVNSCSAAYGTSRPLPNAFLIRK